MIPDVASNPDPRGIFAPGALERLSAGHILNACRPVERGIGRDFVAVSVLAPLAAAFPNADIRADIALSGVFGEGRWRASSGHVLGQFMAPLFGIPATGRVAHLRFGCFQRWESAQVVETILILDLPSLMVQAGVWPLAAPLGPDWLAPPPASRDGIWPEGDGAAALAIVEGMIGGLMKFDGSLKTMNMRDFFAEDFWWYGPAPIGCFHGFDDYYRGHATPFLTAFPDRVGGNHRARFGDGDYVASTGWPSITATHKGDGWLGTDASGTPVTMRVMDFWRAENAKLVENWVMIDIPDVLNQIGIDVFAAMPHRSGHDGGMAEARRDGGSESGDGCARP
ncbi:MAG: ester cyclase [Sphingomonadaceae bacterium]